MAAMVARVLAEVVEVHLLTVLTQALAVTVAMVLFL
jgi:hypothetical protein